MAALVARAPVRSRSTEILCVGSFSITVDQADGDQEIHDAAVHNDEDFDARSDVSNASSRGSRASVSKEETDAKLMLFKTEAAARLSELERLLDEHDQIIRELKRSESDGSGINYVGIAAPSFITTSCSHSPKLTSRTAPTSPLNTHGQNFSNHYPTQFPDVTPAFLKDIPKFSITTHNFSDPPKKKNNTSTFTNQDTTNDSITKTTACTSTNTTITTSHDQQSTEPQTKITTDMGSSSDPVITIVTEKEPTDTADKTTNTEPNTPTG